MSNGMGTRRQTVLNKARVEELTDKVMAMITEDVQAGAVPWTVTNFGQLHDWVDANMYLEHAGQVFDPAEQDSLDEVNAIEDEVSRRLNDGAVTGGGWRRVTWTAQQTHSVVLPLALLRQEHRDEPVTTGEVTDTVIAAFEGDTTLVSRTSRTVDTVEAADPPAYVEPAERYSRASILDDPRVKLRAARAELRRLDSEVKRLSGQERHDGPESPQDEAAEQALDHARKALQLALTLLGMAQGS
jgi:hypothetical protein